MGALRSGFFAVSLRGARFEGREVPLGVVMRELSRIAPTSTIRWANVGKAVVGYRQRKVNVTLEGVCRRRGITMSGHAMRRGWAARLRKSPHFIAGVMLLAVAVPVSLA